MYSSQVWLCQHRVWCSGRLFFATLRKCWCVWNTNHSLFWEIERKWLSQNKSVDVYLLFKNFSSYDFEIRGKIGKWMNLVIEYCQHRNLPNINTCVNKMCDLNIETLGLIKHLCIDRWQPRLDREQQSASPTSTSQGGRFSKHLITLR